MLTLTTFNTYFYFETGSQNCNNPFKNLFRNVEQKTKEIAQIIYKSGSNIVALQEIEDDKILAKLIDQLSKEYGLNYKFYWSGVKSTRTGQSVGFLVLDKEECKIMQTGTFLYQKIIDAVTFLENNCPDFHSLDQKEKDDLFNKNIWMHFIKDGHNFIIVNLHLKAKSDSRSIMIRQLESKLVHFFLNQMKQQFQNVSLIVLGDFNDIDHDVTPVDHPTTVLSTIKNNLLWNCNLKSSIKHSIVERLLIDHILIDNNIGDKFHSIEIVVPECASLFDQHTDSTVLQEALQSGPLVSDHWPVTVQLSI